MYAFRKLETVWEVTMYLSKYSRCKRVIMTAVVRMIKNKWKKGRKMLNK
jgi:hypothetical protein